MYKKFTKHKKILDKKGFISFIIVVTWLVVIGGEIKGKTFILFLYLSAGI